MGSSGFSPAVPPVFNEEGYHIWVVKIKTYLQAFDLWEVVNSDVEQEPLRANPTVAQIGQHADERTKRHKAMSCIQNSVSDMIFTRIMSCETPKQAWDRLKEEFQGTERTSEVRIVEKVVSTLPERYEGKISSLEDSRDLTSIALIELINALYAQEQRRASRLEEHQEGAFQEKTKHASSTSVYKGKKAWRDKPNSDAARRRDQPCRHCKRPGHSEANYWFRPDVQCQYCKKMGHVKKVCKSKRRPRQNQPQQSKAEARVIEKGSDHEE
ncbi:uncharacterized protein LOC105781336 [Gossypium raimondii]|uniref:uncharacterized protein LOC105781336 n=1 Tax=Gossypium raimondii TaxID=29730 RepID=UPI00063AEDC2|nr:uncharacterized protein LOC105781336 [Gossypium raimondii]